jgi:thiamine-phosphate pyrophosphorylase
MRTDASAIRGLYAITPELADTDELLSRVAQAIRGGLALLQYRAKQLPWPLMQRQASLLSELCRSSGVGFIVNDSIELAMESGANGVHLGRDDSSIEQVRDADSRLLVGVSCYDSIEKALAAQSAGADYVAFGSFYPSVVKPDAVRAPLSLLRQARIQLSVPLVAIGGITPANAAELAEAGADAVAVISALFSARDIGRTAQLFTQVFQGRYDQPQRSAV